MTVDKVREVIGIYRKKFAEMGIEQQSASYDSFPMFHADYLAHCYAMLDQMETFLDEGRWDKCQRWLGFLQGVAWVLGVFTINESKDHSRP